MFNPLRALFTIPYIICNYIASMIKINSLYGANYITFSTPSHNSFIRIRIRIRKVY